MSTVQTPDFDNLRLPEKMSVVDERDPISNASTITVCPVTRQKNVDEMIVDIFRDPDHDNEISIAKFIQVLFIQLIMDTVVSTEEYSMEK